MKLGELNRTLFIAIVIVFLITPSLFMSEAKAAPTVSIREVLGSGTGTLTCPDGTEVSAQILLNFAVKKGRANGFGDISSLENPSKFEEVSSFSDVQITKNRFSFSGLLISPFNPAHPEEFQSICGENYLPTKASVSGGCGEGITIEMEATNGEYGIFLGDVSCAHLRF